LRRRQIFAHFFEDEMVGACLGARRGNEIEGKWKRERKRES
jgi:hypothetical protein